MESDLDLIGLFRHIQAKGLTVRTVLLLDVEDTLSTWDLLKLGVDGLVLSNQSPAVLLATIEQLCHGPHREQRLPSLAQGDEVIHG
jgi:DNA-binding NarL/FixJ family response regulator